jgi:hypothetical protein
LTDIKQHDVDPAHHMVEPADRAWRGSAPAPPAAGVADRLQRRSTCREASGWNVIRFAPAFANAQRERVDRLDHQVDVDGDRKVRRSRRTPSGRW